MTIFPSFSKRSVFFGIQITHDFREILRKEFREMKSKGFIMDNPKVRNSTACFVRGGLSSVSSGPSSKRKVLEEIHSPKGSRNLQKASLQFRKLKVGNRGLEMDA